MYKTILPKKLSYEQPIATDDEALVQLINDKTITQFPNNSSVDSFYLTSTQVQSQPQYINTTPQPILTNSAEYNAASNADILVKHDASSESWINKRWRPAMGWMYMVVCIFDFILFPIMYTLVQFYETQAANDAFRQWQPLTLQGAGLFHLAMGAVLGIAAYGRTKEKIEGATK